MLGIVIINFVTVIGLYCIKLKLKPDGDFDLAMNLGYIGKV